MTPVTAFTVFTGLLDRHIFDDSIGIDAVLARALLWFVRSGRAAYCSLSYIGDDQVEVLLASFLPEDPPGAQLSVSDSTALELSFHIKLDCGTFNLRIRSLTSGTSVTMNVLLGVLNDKANVGFRFKEERRFEKVMEDIVRRQLEGDLQPSVAWAAIAEQALKFLPDIEPLKFRLQGARCHILQYQPPKYLVLRASSEEPSAAGGVTPGDRQFIEVSRVVSGLPILQDEEFIHVNPTKSSPELYAAYLSPAGVPQSQVSLAIVHEAQVIGILNFEHPDEDAFSQYTIAVMRRVAKTIAPFINALANRERRIRWKEKGMFYVIASMIERLNDDLAHRVDNAVLRTRLRCEDNIKSPTIGPKERDDFSSILRNVEEIRERSQAFLADVPEYLNAKHLDLARITSDAISDARTEQSTQSQSIEFRVDIPSPCLVYASLLLRENIKNLIVNSIIAVLDRLGERNDQGGLIEIKADIRKSSEFHCREDLSPGRVYFEIRDNGEGVPEDLLSKVREYGFTTRRNRGGTGFGLSAAIDYVQTIFGGDFECANIPGGGFRVSFYLLQYTSELESVLAPVLVNHVEKKHVQL